MNADRRCCPSHCCPLPGHGGCKYGYEDCPVVSGEIQPERVNENGCAQGRDCDDNGVSHASRETLTKVADLLATPLRIERTNGRTTFRCRLCDLEWGVVERHRKDCFLYSEKYRQALNFFLGQEE